MPVDHAVATGRDELRFNGVDYLVNRRRFVLAPAGMSWNETTFQSENMDQASHKPAAFPTMDNIGNGKYWTRVADQKLIPFVKFTTTDEAIKQTTTTSPTTDGKQ